jgi:SAM-dependent methyltransferase
MSIDDPFFTPYQAAFWNDYTREQQRAAQRNIAYGLYNILHPKSVVDVGCAAGQLLQAFRDQHVPDLVGFESSNAIEWTKKLKIQECGDIIWACDLRHPISIVPPLRPDLVVCTEVAEHLPELDAKRLVRDICKIYEPAWLCFSGAEPGSGGTAHINEHSLGYWVDLIQDYHTHVLDKPRSDILRRWLGSVDQKLNWFGRINLYRRRDGI